MNTANENTKPATAETNAEFLDCLAADQIKAGKDVVAAGIKTAADEIRRLDRKLVYSRTAEDLADQKLGNLSNAILGIINHALESKIEEIAKLEDSVLISLVESKIDTALNDYDPTDHNNFYDAVTEHVSEVNNEQTREIVLEVLENGQFAIVDSFIMRQ